MKYWRIMVAPELEPQHTMKVINGWRFAVEIVWGWKLEVGRTRRSRAHWSEIWVQVDGSVAMQQVTAILLGVAKASGLQPVDCGYVAPESEHDRPEWWIRLEV